MREPFDPLRAFARTRLAESDRIDQRRRQLLDTLAEAISAELRDRGTVDLVFICTHNSRRSQFGQIWAKVAADLLGVAGVRTWSGGTEATAFDARAVAALARAGAVVATEAGGANPTYQIRTSEQGEPARCWSKRFDDPANPTAGFVAVMTCSAADEACPAVPGARQRFAVPYDDPKLYDGTDRETEAYDERCAQIAREMLQVLRRVADRRPIT